jgi:hypothetical protein
MILILIPFFLVGCNSAGVKVDSGKPKLVISHPKPPSKLQVDITTEQLKSGKYTKTMNDQSFRNYLINNKKTHQYEKESQAALNAYADYY